MANPAQIIEKVRAYGANVMLDGHKLIIINREKLPAGAMEFIKKNAKQIGVFLENECNVEERAAIIEFDGGLTRQTAEYLTHLLHASTPADANAADWSWFVSKAANIIERVALRGAA